MPKILGIDFGEKRIGLAVSDEMKVLALPHKVLTNDNNVVAEIKTIVQKENIAKIVLGLPLGLSGKETDTTRQVKEFAEKLKEEIRKPVVFQDERMTSVASQKELRGKKKISKEDIDLAAARLILQSYLERVDWKKGVLK